MKNVVVIGASGGIGGAFIQNLDNRESIERIYAFSRRPISSNSPKVISSQLDLLDESSIQSAVDGIEGTIDTVIVATGILHTQKTQPEKSLKDLNLNNFEEIFAVNTFGPALIAKHFVPLFPRDQKTVFAALSARVGSISDNHLGGWYAYRASKAALNMLIKTTAIETSRKYKQAAIIGLHPGTVDTGLSKPFQGFVKEGKLFTPEYSTQKMLEVIDGVSAEDTGKIFAWDGQEIHP